MRSGVFATAGVLGALAAQARAGDERGGPFRIEAGGEPITVDVGHAAPFVGDFDGDGVRDLLVGEFSQGRMRIFRNVGTDTEPQFEDHVFFEAGGELGRVPAG
jgi:hypothetical protein